MLSQLSRTEENINKHIKSLGSPVDTLKKTLSLTQSFAGVLKKELDLLESTEKKEDKENKDKDKDKHKKKKKEGDEKTDFISQAGQFHQNALKLISAVESALLAVNKFDDERAAIQKDYEAFARQQTQLKENVRILKAENAILKRKLALSGTHVDDVSDGEASVEEGGPSMKVPLTPTASNLVSPAVPRANEEREDIANIMTGTHTIDSDSDSASDDSTMYFDPEEAEQQNDHSDDSDHAVSKPRSITNSKKGNAADDLQLVSSPSRRLLMLSQSAKNTAPPAPATNNLEETFKSVPTTWKRRAELPADKDPKAKISLVKILKDAIGKDISKITLPVQLCEPLSLLQRLVEDFEYCDLLNQAAAIADPMLRMVYIGCFSVSGYSSTYDRLSKQFNSILGETYELVREDKGFRIFAEQVSHHPPISAAVAEGREWHFWGHAHVKNKFWGKSLEIYPSGVLSLKFPKYGDHYVWSRCTTCVHNVLVGNKWIEHYGEIEIMNNGKNERVVMELKKKGWFSSGGNEVYGTVYDADNKARYRIEGKWTESLSAYPVDDAGQPIKEKGFLVWKMNPLPAKSQQQFKFTSFSMGLNELPDWLVPILPRSDSRFRTDQRALENGDVDLAGTEKSRLEEKQRAIRKKREQEGTEYKPRWFDKSADGVWTYKGGYWETRLKGEWTDVPDLY
jgi:hypothetical protein